MSVRKQWLLVAILLAGFAYRLYRLGADSLWYDETVSRYLANESVPALVSHTARDIHPPGYYLLLHTWTRMAGQSEFSLAFFSVWWGMLLIAFGYRFGRLVFSMEAGLLTACIVAFSPYNLWYSQEVRMYTLGAVLGMGVLAVVLTFTRRPPRVPRWSGILAYALLAAMGVWVLYYFAFLLVAVNILILGWWMVQWRRGAVGWPWLARWAVGQVAILLLYAAWLPVAWRQATAPPVPPWRAFTALGPLVLDAWTALSIGQAADPARVWPILIMAGALPCLALLAAWRRRRADGQARASEGPHQTVDRSAAPWILAGAAFLPVVLIYLASYVVPLYHVRYLFLYSTPFYVLLGAGFAALRRWWAPAMWLALAGLAAFWVCSAQAYHTEAVYASDDHRGATQFLSERWSQGDAILVNAGYAYTAPDAYWSGDPFAWRGRLGDPGGAESHLTTGQPVLFQTGTVGGDASLGWGHAESDFYAATAPETTDALEQLFLDFDRVWVYRIYDTVTDPEGVIRRWLEENTLQFEDRVFAGEAQLRVQGYQSRQDAEWEPDVAVTAPLADGSMELAGHDRLPAEVQAGGYLYLAPVWDIHSEPSRGAVLFTGLFDEGGGRWAQADERPLGTLLPVERWSPGSRVRTPLGIPVPPATPPGRYGLEVGWYTFLEGTPVWLPWSEGERRALGDVEVTAPDDWWRIPAPEPASPADITVGSDVRFLGFDAGDLQAYAGDRLDIDLYWRALEVSPQPGMVWLQIKDNSGAVVMEDASAPVHGKIPFPSLAAGQAVRDPRSLTLPGNLAPGIYDLHLGRRSGSGEWLPVSRGVLPLGSTYRLATIRVLERTGVFNEPVVQQALDARFGDTAVLIGMDGAGGITDLAGLEEIGLTLHWQALAPTEGGHKVYLHLVGDGGDFDIRSQVDQSPPVPTTAWLAGEYIAEQIAVEIPANLPAGTYRLLLGMYEEVSGRRVEILDGAGQALGDSVELGVYRVEE